MLLKTQLRLAGHVSRMQVHRLPKIVLYDELSSNTLKYLLKKSLSACHIDHRQWLVLAADREAWRHAVHQSVSSFENNRRAALQERRSRRKNRIVSAPTPDSLYPCSRCGVPVTYWPCQPPASLHQTWQTLSIFIFEVKPNKVK